MGLTHMSDDVVTVVANTGEAAGVTEINSAAVDVRDAHGVRFVTQMGEITAGAVTSVKIQESPDNSNWFDLEGTSASIADDADDKAVIHDIVAPKSAYYRAVVSRATQNSAITLILGEVYRVDQSTVTQDASVGTYARFNSPNQGTA